MIQREWVNYSAQFNWALTQLDADTDWVLRIDADEMLTPALAAEIQARLPQVGSDIDGVFWSPRMTFQGKFIRHGGVFPVRVLRLFRHERGECENRWMDEHIKVAGPTIDFAGEMIDDNLNSPTWWTDKHNSYASREAVDLLNLEYGFMPHDSVANLRGGKQVGVKRWLKERVYARTPSGFRAFVYFFYRYVLRLGFLDGQAGTAFHVLQGFWYRYLVHQAQLAALQSEPDNGIYDALNKGLALARGDVVGFLHADDLYAHPRVLERVATAFQSQSVCAVYGDLQSVRQDDTTQVVRHWRSSPATPTRLAWGWMPPHPTLYVRREWYQRIGGFDSRYRIAADYLSILQLFSQPGFKATYLPEVLVTMRLGGASNRSLKAIARKSREDWRALRETGVGAFGGVGALVWKNLSKIGQFA